MVTFQSVQCHPGVTSWHLCPSKC